MAGKSQKYNDLPKRYEEGATLQQLANHYGTTFQAIWVALKIREAKLRGRGRPRKEKTA